MRRVVRCSAMAALKAQVRHGRLVMDVPTKLPEGTVLELTAADPGDDLDEGERAALHRSLRRSWKQAKVGKTRPASELLRKLRRRRRR